MIQGKNTSLNFHLAQTITGFVYASGDTLNRRIEILDACHGLVSAMVGHLDNSKEDLQSVDASICDMLKGYENVLDDTTDNRHSVREKRLLYKETIREAFKILMTVIYRNKLLDNSVMAKLEGKKWGDSD